MFTHNILMCRPDHYTVSYSINPWMESGKPDNKLALEQWIELHHTIIRLGGFVKYISPQPYLPDMVFTANGGLVYGKKVVISRFAHRERQAESAHFRQWFQQMEYDILDLEEGELFEGNGDSFIFNDTLFLGSGTRSNAKVGWKIMEFFGLKKMILCELSNPRFYHLDTCFCPLDQHNVLLFPQAFSEATLSAFKTERINIIKVTEEDAVKFACNAICLGKEIIIPSVSDTLKRTISDYKYKCHTVNMSEFIKAGGSAKCLTLQI